MKRISIIGSTGSIGITTLGVIDKFPGEFSVVGLSAHSNADLLIAQALKYHPKIVAVGDKNKYAAVRSALPKSIDVTAGRDGIEAVATFEETDLLVSAIVGFAGLYPTLAAVKKGINIALANKESLVVAGELIIRTAREKNVQIYPLDSEHNAIFQCLNGQKNTWVKRLHLTASGGPFLHFENDTFAAVTVQQALAHPNWNMGKKISIDSATLMNKGLEVIEAQWLFGIELRNIEVIIHPESIIHSMVEFVDGSYLAQMNIPDMSIPIQYILTYPERRNGFTQHAIDFTQLGKLRFLRPDMIKFPCLKLAYYAAEQGSTMPAVLNAANECAVELFLNGKISFVDIPKIIEHVMSRHTVQPSLDYSILEDVDSWARQCVKQKV